MSELFVLPSIRTSPNWGTQCSRCIVNSAIYLFILLWITLRLCFCSQMHFFVFKPVISFYRLISSLVPRPWTRLTVNRCLKNSCRPAHVLHAPSPLSPACRQREHLWGPARCPLKRFRNPHKPNEVSAVSCQLWMQHVRWMWSLLYVRGVAPPPRPTILLCFNEAVCSLIKLETTSGVYWPWCRGFPLCSRGTTKLIWKPQRADGKTGREALSAHLHSPAAPSYRRLSPAGPRCAKGCLVGKMTLMPTGGGSHRHV